MSTIDSQVLNKSLLVAGTALSAYLSGMIGSLSVVSIPSVLDQPTTHTSLSTWRSLYLRGKGAMPPLSILVASINLTNAYLHRKSSPRSAYFSAAAAVSAVAIVPFTFAFMSSNIKDLEGREETARKTGKTDLKTTRDMIAYWGKLNLIRSLLPAVGALLSFFAI